MNKENYQIIRVAQGPGKEAELKRLLFAAKGDTLIVIEHNSITDEEAIRALPALKDTDIVLGIPTAIDNHRFFKRCVNALLGKGLHYLPCLFRIIHRDKMENILGRIYLEEDGLDVEWAYITSRLNYKVKVIPVDSKETIAFKPAFKMYWNLCRIRNWHFTKINSDEEHMSSATMAEMYTQESKHWWFTAKGKFMQKLMRLTNIGPGNVLDAGCGTGHNMRFLNEQNFYVGTDVSMQALEFCKHNGHARLVQSHLQKLPFSDDVFDVVLALDVVEHTKNPWAVAGQIKRVLKPGGHFIVSVPACRFLFSQHDEALSHLRRYDRGDLKKLLVGSGFEIVRLEYMYCFTFFPVAIIRIFRKIFVKDEKPSSDMYYLPAPFVNQWMKTLMDVEISFFGKFPLPIGTSIVAVAVKK